MGYKSIEDQRRYQRVWMANRRAAFFEGKTCVMCGSNQQLELDHIDPSTKVTSRIWSYSAEKRAEELAKCQVLCHDCHLKKTIAEHSTAVHGTNPKYTGGCRCDSCRIAHNRANNEWRYRTGKRGRLTDEASGRPAKSSDL